MRFELNTIGLSWLLYFYEVALYSVSNLQWVKERDAGVLEHPVRH